VTGGLALLLATSFSWVAASASTKPHVTGHARASGALTVALTEPPASLDPLGPDSAAIPTLEIAQQVFDGLIRPGSKPGTYVPDLATSWTHPSADVWSFKLRTDARFANGTRVTAHDVVASLKALIAGKSPEAALWTLYSNVTAPNSHTVVIRTSSQMGTMLSAVALLSIVPAGEINNTSYWNKPFGSGPFKVERFLPDESVTLVPNSHYWGTAPKLRTLTMIDVPNESDLTAYLKTGKVDVAISVPPDQVSTLRGTRNLKIYTTPSYSEYWIWFNEGRSPFNNVLVRRAMWYALPINSIVKSVWGKFATVSTSPIASSVFGYAKQDPYPYDPAKAKQLLAQAGYPNGFSTSMMWEAAQAPYLQTMASLFVSAWAAVGINVTMDQQDPATWLSNLLALNWNMNMQEASDLTGDADYIIGRLYMSTSHRMGYDNPALDALLTDARESVNPALRAKLYARADKLIWQQAVGIYPLNPFNIVAVRTNVHGFNPVPSTLDSFAGVSVG
jgi:peptide/nickel transport system substrate-binding protein